MKGGKAPKWQALFLMGEGRRCSRKGWGDVWVHEEGSYDRHSFLRLSESFQKWQFILMKGASVDPGRTTAVINPFCCTAEALNLRDHTTRGQPLQSTQMTVFPQRLNFQEEVHLVKKITFHFDSNHLYPCFSFITPHFLYVLVQSCWFC